MSNKNDENILKWTVIGGIIGICAISLLMSSKKENPEDESSLASLAKVINHLGKILDNHDLGKSTIISNVEKKVHKNEETISDVLDLISSGMHLWKKFSKGL